jgi:CRISPR-associated protein Cas5d
MPESHIIKLKVWGDYACFTRPELKVERISYTFMTPSAARGILDAILFKKKTDQRSGKLVPAFSWHVRRITALQPWWIDGLQPVPNYRMLSVRRNEIQGKISGRSVLAWMKSPAEFEPYQVDSAGREAAGGANRTQRNSLVLRNVAYLIEASVHLAEYSETDPPVKYREMFERRASKGQAFHRPYFGCREFACHFAPPDGSEKPVSEWTEDLGLMLYDIRFSPNGKNLPGFFAAHLHGGALHCDTASPAPWGAPPVTVLGWPNVA